jgi:anti-sigma regulatory factor (Ser/Thr protein kinase)
VIERWSFVTSRVTPLLESSRDKLEVPSHALVELQHAIKARAPYGQLANIVEGWTHESVARRFNRFADQARTIASRTGKGTIGVRVDCPADLAVAPETWAPIWASFSHAIRNAVDHGIVSATGDDLVLRACVFDGKLVLEIEDHGPGVDWERVRAKAEAYELPCATRQDLEAALFHDGLSTRDEVTETSGRGVGMAALREACASTGGVMSLDTSSAGTTIRLSWAWPSSTSVQLLVG